MTSSREPSARDSGAASPAAEVRRFYDASAGGYAKMMDDEIGLPLYDEVLGRLAGRIEGLEGAVLDSACGSGHMLEKLRGVMANPRALIGVDLAPEMVKLARARLGGTASIHEADMRRLPSVASGSCAAVISFFALHHVDRAGMAECLAEWQRVLCVGGFLTVATWEGEGAIDYGDATDVVALRYRERQVRDAAVRAGFTIERSVVEPVEGMAMSAIYLDAGKPHGPAV